MHQLSLQEAATHISSVFSDVMSGEEVILTDHDTPVMKVIPLAPVNGSKRLTFGCMQGEFKMSDDFNDTPEDFADYI